MSKLLRVNITKRSIQRIQQISQRRLFHAQERQLNWVIERSIPTRRAITKCDSPRNRPRLIQMQRLPHPPHTIHHGVMQVESRIHDARIEIRVGSRKRLVTSPMHTRKPHALVLDLGLEAGNVPGCLAHRDVEECLLSEDAGREPAAEVPRRAVWVVL